MGAQFISPLPQDRKGSGIFFVNGRSLARQVTGVERYAREMVAALGDRVTVIRPSAPRNGLGSHLWEQIMLPGRLPLGAVLWSPANTGPLRAERHVVTIHDLSPLEHPEWFRPAFAAGYRWLLPRLIQRARRVVTDSDFIRRRLIERGVPPAKISVVAPGVSSSFRPAPQAERDRVRAKYALKTRYALFLGSIEPRKNVTRLLQAWRLIAASFPDHELAIAGSTGSAFAKVDLDGTPARTRWLGYVPDGDLPGLYSAADVFVLVSIDEGFGLTALEAMACGTPLLLSRAGALPEVAGESARYVDPLDVEGIAGGLRDLLRDEPARSRLAEEGRERSLQFRWETAADSVWAVLQEVAGG